LKIPRTPRNYWRCLPNPVGACCRDRHNFRVLPRSGASHTYGMGMARPSGWNLRSATLVTSV
jgi:hypothetical protein